MNNTKIILSDNYGSGKKHYLDCTDVNIPITYTVADVRNIGQRNTAYTKSIKLPGSKNNNQIFTHIFEVNNAINFNPAKKAYCVVLVDEIAVLYGYFQLTAINIIDSSEVEYEGVMFGVLGDIVSILGDTLLAGNVDASGSPAPGLDLSFAELSHNAFDHTNIENSWTGTTANYGYIYPFINYGFGWNNNSTGKGGLVDFPVVPLQDLFPSIYCKRIWDKIFTNCGYQYNSTFLNSDLFKRLYLAGNPKSPGSPITAYISNDTTPANIGFIPFDDTSNLGFDVNQQWQVKESIYLSGNAGYGFTPEISGTYDFTINVTARATSSFVTIALSDINSGTAPFAPNYFAGSIPIVGSTVINNSQSFDLVAGHTYFIQFVVGGTAPPVSFDAGGSISFRLHDTSGIDLNYALPTNLKQVDFITSIVKMFNLIIEQDKDNPTLLYIEPRDAYYANGTLVDWSQKIDRASDYQLKLISELAGLTYNFSYTNDNDFENTNYKALTNETYGQEIQTIDNDFVTNVVNISPTTAPTGFYAVQGFDKFIVPALYQNTNDTFKPFDFKPRILYNTGINVPIAGVSGGGTGKIYVDYAGVVGTPYTQYGSYYFTGSYEIPNIVSGVTAGNAVSLNYGNIISKNNFDVSNISHTLFNAYWANYLSQISSPNSKVLRAKFLLSALDIEKIRFNDTIYLELENSPSYWYINQIIDYNPVLPDLTEVELIYIDPNPDIIYGSVFKNNKVGFVNQGNGGAAESVINGKKNLIDSTGQNMTVNGNLNVVANNTNGITVLGNQNKIGPDAENVFVQGTGNLIPSGTTNVTVIGNNITVTGSSQTYYADPISINGHQVLTDADITTGSTSWTNGMIALVNPDMNFFSFMPEKGMLLPGLTTSERLTVPLDGSTNGFICLDTTLNVVGIIVNGAWKQATLTPL